MAGVCRVDQWLEGAVHVRFNLIILVVLDISGHFLYLVQFRIRAEEHAEGVQSQNVVLSSVEEDGDQELSNL